ncbi:MAG TPA: DUF3306 domain-containing protein [Burkholderiaceae bacterium]
MTASEGDGGFFSRWSQRKALARQGAAPPALPTQPERPPAEAPAATSMGGAVTPAVALPVQPVDLTAAAPGHAQPQPASPPPTLADVAALTRESNYSRFVAPDVDSEVRNAALKNLFSDPRFNVMDGLDVYIDDYSKPDPLPLSSVRKMAQAAFLGLIDAEPAQPAVAAAVAAQAPTPAQVDAAGANCGASPETDENADLRLQSHDAAGCGGAPTGAAADEPRQL